MIYLFSIFIAGLLLGQLGGITLTTAVIVYVHDILLALLLVAGAAGMMKKHRIIRPRLLYPILAFTAAGILSLSVNTLHIPASDLFLSSLYLVRWCMYAMLYFLLVQNVVPVKILLYALYLYGVGVALLGFLQFGIYPDLRNLTYLGWDPHYYRLFSTLLDPNFAGIILVCTFFLGLYLWQQAKSSHLLIAEFLLLIAVYLTYSRSSYLALAAGMVAVAVYLKKWMFIACLVLFAGAVLFIPTPGGKTLRLNRVDSTVARFENWQDTLSVISHSPVIGYGFNTMKYVRNPAAVDQFTPASRATSGVDSSLLFVLATTGIIGFVAYVWLLITPFYGRARSVDASGIQILTATLTVSLLVHSLFSNSLFYSWVMLFLWCVLAAAELIYDK